MAGGVAAQTERPHEARFTVLQESSDRLLVELPNRLLVIAQELHTAPVVSVQAWVKTGSIYEQEHVGAGLSHLLEHLASGGTTQKRSEQEANRLLGLMGADTNAGTSLDTVSYYINTTSEHTATAVDLLSDWMQHSRIEQDEFEREKEVILREFEMGEGDPGRIFWKLTQQARYMAHPARQPTIGYRDEFLSITLDEVRDFYRRMYAPNNMLFVVVGDIDRRAVVDQVARLWEQSEARELPEPSFPVEPTPSEPRQVTGVAAIQRPRLRLAWPGTRLAAPGDYELDLLAAVLGQGEASRLVRSVRDEAGAVTQIDAYNLSFAWGEGFFAVDAEVATPPPTGDAEADVAAQEAAIERAKGLILAEVASLLEAGVGDEASERAKRQTLARVAMQGQTVQHVAYRLANDLINTGDPDYLVRYGEEVQELSSAEVTAAGRRFLDPSRLITVRLLPVPPGEELAPLTRASLPPEAEELPREAVILDNRRLVEDLRSHGDATRQARTIETDPVETWELPNGLRVVFGRSTLVPAVSIQLYQLGGLLAEAPGRQGAANAAAELRMRGTAKRTATQLAAAIEDLGANVATGCGNNTTFTRADALKEDFEAIAEIVAEVILEPSFPEDEWERLEPRLLAAIDRRTDHWTSELSLLFRGAYFAGTPWSTSALGERDFVAALTASQLRSFYYDRLGAGQSVLAVFGDLDPAQARRVIEKHFSAMPSRAEIPFVKPSWSPPSAGVVLEKSAKPLSAVQVGFGPGPVLGEADLSALRVLAEVLGAFPHGWLAQELRGRGPGLVYAVSAFPFAGLARGYFGVLFNGEPERLPLALERTVGVLDRARREEVHQEELERAKAGVLAAEFLYKQSNGNRAADAALNVLYGMGLDQPERFARQVRELSAGGLRTAAEKYLRNPVAVVLAAEPPAEEVVEKALADFPGTSP